MTTLGISLLIFLKHNKDKEHLQQESCLLVIPSRVMTTSCDHILTLIGAGKQDCLRLADVSSSSAQQHFGNKPAG